MRLVLTLTIAICLTCSMAMADAVSVVPPVPQAGSTATITFDATGRVLEGEPVVQMHYGFNNWYPTVDPDVVMSTNGAPYSVEIAIPTQATEINLVFNNGGDVWDNNDGWNWLIATTNGVPNPRVTMVPETLVAGQNVTIKFDPVGGPLESESLIGIYYDFNGLTQHFELMTWNSTESVYEATVEVKSYAETMNLQFDDGTVPPGTGAIWDHNDGFDWHFPVTGTVPTVTLLPDPPVAGQSVTVTYNPEDGPLDASTTAFLHWGINDFENNSAAYDEPMTLNGDVWEVTVDLPIRACEFNFVFNDGADTWDNNNENDWNYETEGCIPRKSELDGLYIAKYIDQWDPFYDTLHIGLAGNLENDGSAMVIFIDTPSMTGQTELRVDGVDEGSDLLPLASRQNNIYTCDTIGTGTVLPEEADFALLVNYSGTTLYFDEYLLSSTALDTLTCCSGATLDVFAGATYIGSTAVNDGNQIVEDNPGRTDYFGGFDDTNLVEDPASVLTGLEVGIPMYRIAAPHGLGRNDDIKVFAAIMPNVDGVRGQFSNQWLPAADETAGYCDPPALFPLRADLSSYTTAWTGNVASLPSFNGVADGVIVPSNYSGSADELQTCPVPEAAADNTVTVQPDPVQGEDVTVWYVSTNGPLDGSDPIYLNYDFDGASTLSNRVMMVATNGYTSSEFIATVTMPSDALLFDVNFDDGATTHDNNGHNWHFPISVPPTGDTVEISPNPAEAGQPVTIYYNPMGRNLEGADQVYIHVGFNNWNPTLDPDPAMTRTSDCRWEITVSVPSFAMGEEGLNMVFNDGGSVWDNNDSNNWNFEVTSTALPSPWVMDGYLDACAELVATSSGGEIELYAGMRDGYLYVATDRSQNNNDHFILVAGPSGPGAPMGSPWAKGGTTATWDAFLAQEVSNGWTGWFDLEGDTNRGNNPQSEDLPYLEGYVDIGAELGAAPSTIYLAVGVWGNDNGTPLVASLQVPAGNSDGNVDADEYEETSVLAIEVTGPFDTGDFDEDCDVDLVDYTAFELCLVGPDGMSGGSCEVDADFNADGDVDLRDFAVFQAAFTN